jgi:alkanesulfonate monooxygenase SsuD/methylene tetrahydromethanopterin reductase-like flavin-dependent oxidoreductase (luciferase family)
VSAEIDTKRPIEFGANIDPSADQYQPALRLARLADDLGYDLIGIQDHPYQHRFLDTFTLIATLVPLTRRVRFFPNVTDLPLRPPAMVAKAAASLDLISDGRFELGLGAGAFWEAIAAMGGPRRTPGQAVGALEEAIAVIRMFWSGERGLRFEGTHYTLRGVNAGPRPAHDIGIWIGGGRPRMLGLIGRLADGWIPSLVWAPPDAIPDMQRRIDQAALTAGRRPRDIRRVYNVAGRIASGPVRKLLDGPPAHWVEELTRFVVELGMDTFMFWPTEDPERQLRAFAEEVIPGTRNAFSNA